MQLLPWQPGFNFTSAPSIVCQHATQILVIAKLILFLTEAKRKERKKKDGEWW